MPMTKTRSRTLPMALLAGSLCGLAIPAAGEIALQPSLAVEDADPGRVAFSLSNELPWLLRRSALLDLRLHESPKPSDYDLTANLLSFASELDPTNAETAREMAQAAWLAGDQTLMLDATRRVIAIDPKDSVAQLRLISANINTKQTVEERRAIYDRFLSDAGESIDPAVRSRLALDAALLERESGNTVGFIERLHQATRLDVTNKSAASLAAQFYASIRRNPVTNLDYQIRLLNADPLDANVQLTIARMLAVQGALQPARRFLENASALFRFETGEIPQSVEEIRIAVAWQLDGSQEIMHQLNSMLEEQRGTAQAQIQAYREQLLPTDSLPTPESIRYPLGVDRMRLFAAFDRGDERRVRSVITDIERTLGQQVNQLLTMASRQGANPGAILSQVVQTITELQGLRALVGADPARIRSEMAGITERQPVIAQGLAPVEPLVLYAEGKYEQALTQSEPFRNIPVVTLMRARSLEQLGRNQEAADLYLDFARQNAINGFGAYARARLRALGREGDIITESGSQMTVIADKVPAWIDEIIERPGSFHFLRVEPTKRTFREGEQPTLRIRLQNTAPIPLALGPNAPIDSRILIEPVGVKTQENGFMGETRPRVLQLDHRLRLEPLEEIEVEVVADSATTDWLIDLQPGVSLRQRWRLIQNYRTRISDSAINQRRTRPNAPVFGIINSPLGLTAETPVVQRLGLAAFRAQPSELIGMLSRDDADARRRAVLALSAHLMNPNPGEQLDLNTIDQIVGALNDAYTAAPPAERAAMLLVLPQRHQVPQMIAFDDHVAASVLSDALIDSEADPLLLACALLTRTDDPEAPIFETLRHANDERVERIASIVRSRLRENRPIIGTVGPGLDAMTPSFDGLESD